MNSDQLRTLLEKKYSIIKCIDLADLTVNKTAAFKFFKSIYQSEFENNARIIIYSSKSPSLELVSHLYQATEINDIGNWFVLLCVPHIINDPRIGNDSFQYLKIQLEQTKELSSDFYLPPTICAIPWSHIEITQDGSVTPCCNSTLVAGKITDDTLTNLFNSKKIQWLRNELLAGKKPIECNDCWSCEDKGLTSIRQHNTKRLNDLFFNETLDTPKITSLDIKFQNTCNFKCIICDSGSSSLHAQEKFKYLNIPIKSQVAWSESDWFINQIDELLPSLTNIDMYGGEPFLIKKFAEVLKSAVDRGLAKNIRLHYNSNGSIWPKEFIDYWKHFKEVDIHFSIDAVGKRFEYQRGGIWDDVHQNILKIKDLGLSNLTISIMPTLSILNIYYIDEVLDWACKYNFQVFPNYVSTPDALSLKELTTAAKEIITDKYQKSSWSEMHNILSSINSAESTDGTKFCDYIRWYDVVRDTNFKDAHYDIATSMGYVK